MKSIATISFIADVHLGKLARWLRMFGFDVIYDSNLKRAALLRLAYETGRVLLTRDRKLAPNPFITLLLIESENPEAQLKQVIGRFGLLRQVAPFTRCLVCNTPLQSVPKPMIEHKLATETKKAFHEFWQCSHCGRIYWKGSHYERMQQMITSFSSI